MFEPQAHSVLWFMAGFLALWSASLIARGALSRSREGTPRCPGCGGAIPAAEEGKPPRTVCPGCGFEARSRREFWPRTPRAGAIAGGVLMLAVSCGVFALGYVEASLVRRADPEIFVTTAVYGLAAGVASLMGWALWGGPVKGRKRCPKCWYEMESLAAAGVLTCPECGHDAASHRNLYGRRRRTRLFLALVPVLAAVLLLPTGLAVWRSGPLAAVPTPVMILGMWTLPREWITGGSSAVWSGQTSDASLAARLGGEPRLTPSQTLWAMAKVRAELENPGSPERLRRATELALYDADQEGVSVALLGVLLAIAESSDADHLAIGMAVAPQLGARAQWSDGALRRELRARGADLARLMGAPRPQANLYAMLAAGLGDQGAVAVPALEAGLAVPGKGLNRATALRTLWALQESCPEAEAAVLRALASADAGLVGATLDAAEYQPLGVAVVRRLEEIAGTAEARTAASAIRALSTREEWWTAKAAWVRETARVPGPRREAALRALMLRAGAYWRADDELEGLLASAAGDADARVRLAVVEACADAALLKPGLRALLKTLAQDGDAAVSQAARAADAALP